MILSLALAGSLIIATSACNSTKNVSNSADSTGVDSAASGIPDTTVVDTTKKDTSRTMPPDTTRKMPPDTTKTPGM